MQKVLLTLIVILFSIKPSFKETNKPIIVLELFTSQGCSSCPAADELLKDVRRNYAFDEVITLSYHVDYWDYIGWKDPFSKKKFTEKQKQYGSKFYSSSIYTPQVVINGKEHFVGSERRIMEKKLKEYQKEQSENRITLSNIENKDGLITFDYNADGDLTKKWLSILLVINDRTTKVNRGENKNRTLHNSNIVVSESTKELNTFGKGSLIIPDLVQPDDELSLVAIIQKSNFDITGGSQSAL